MSENQALYKSPICSFIRFSQNATWISESRSHWDRSFDSGELSMSVKIAADDSGWQDDSISARISETRRSIARKQVVSRRAIKPRYSPVPCRAMGDTTLTALDHRVLSSVAGHDCFETYGMGCTAGIKRLARMVRAAPNSVKRSLKKLTELGYIYSKVNPNDRRRRSYHIIYTPGDHAIFNLDSMSSDTGSFENAKIVSENFGDLPARDRAPKENDWVTGKAQSVTKAAEIGNRPSRVCHCKSEESNTLIEESKYKSGNKTHSIEAGVCDLPAELDAAGKGSSQFSPARSHRPEFQTRFTAAIIDAWFHFKGVHPNLSVNDQESLKHSIGRHGDSRLLHIIARARASPFLRGEVGDWNGMPFKWLWNDNRLTEIERGEHDGKSNRKTSRHSPGTVEDIRELLVQAKNDDHKG